MLEQLAATYGPAFSVRIPRMPEPMVFFSDPAAIKDITLAPSGGMPVVARPR